MNNDREHIGRCVEQLVDGTFGALSGNFESIHAELMNNNDYDFVIADFASYTQAWRELTDSYDDTREWQRKALANIANSGHFSSAPSVSTLAISGTYR